MVTLPRFYFFRSIYWTSIFLIEPTFRMATPEIKLPLDPSPTTTGDKDTAPDTGHEFSKTETGPKVEHGQAVSSTSQLDDIPIVYHYLTFEAELPSPSSLGPVHDGSSVPEPPDLRNFVSPFTWSEPRKTFTTWLSCLITVATAYTAGSYSPASDQLSAYWGVSQTAILVGITTFTTGFATAPMILAPFSELNGRRPVFIATGILFVICQLCCAVTRSYPGMLVARFFAGVGGSTFSTMVGGVVSDIYHTEGNSQTRNPSSSAYKICSDRNTPMALFSGAALFGTGLGPLVSGFIAQNVSWRWVFYFQVITCGLFILAVVVFFKETRGSVLLSKRARLINGWYEAREKVGLIGFDVMDSEEGKKKSQRIRWRVKSDEDRESLRKMIGLSVYRPFRQSPLLPSRQRSSFETDLLSTEPVVFFFSLWVAFSWAVLYLTFSAIPLVFSTNHGFNVQQNGAVFAGTRHSSL